MLKNGTAPSSVLIVSRVASAEALPSSICPSPVRSHSRLIMGYFRQIRRASSLEMPKLPRLIWYRFSERLRPILIAKRLVDMPLHFTTCSSLCQFVIVLCFCCKF